MNVNQLVTEKNLAKLGISMNAFQDQILKQNMKNMERDVVSLQGARSDRTKSVHSKCSRDPYNRMSVRSKGSSASGEEKATVIKTFCRSLVEFMFTQVRYILL